MLEVTLSKASPQSIPETLKKDKKERKIIQGKAAVISRTYETGRLIIKF